jgi:surface antigen/peptidoglycan hydrolase CwlO-like protein
MLMFKVKSNKTNMIQKVRNTLSTTKRRLTAASLVAMALLVAGVAIVPRVDTIVNANSNDEIQRLQEENTANKSIVARLQGEATSYQDAINRLQPQIDYMQTQIDLNTAKQNEIQASITANEAELLRQKSILGENIRVSYVEGRITTIEMLATSKNLSDFVDKEEYHTTIKNKIQTTLVRINELQNQLKEQKTQVERLLAEQQTQRNELAAARAEQSRMLAYNKSQQNDYNQKTKDNNARIQALIAAQRRANSSTDGGYYFLRFPGAIRDFNPANYPYQNSGFSMSTLPGCGNPDPRTGQRDSTDRWGYCTRQCVSYAAWAVEASGRRAPTGYGSAKNWVNAAGSDVEISRTPQAGDIAISTKGEWGHAMYVEKVISSDKILVSQYNASLDGEFSYQERKY